jgi:hypothetical protein
MGGKIHRLMTACSAFQTIDRRVVALLQADRRSDAGAASLAQHFLQVRRTQFRRSAGAGGVLGQPDVLAGFVSRRVEGSWLAPFRGGRSGPAWTPHSVLTDITTFPIRQIDSADEDSALPYGWPRGGQDAVAQSQH